MKRKKMIKLLMANGIPRNKATFYADLCGGKMPHRFLAAFAIARPDLCDSLWDLWIRGVLRRTCCHPKLELVKHGET